MCDVEAVSHGHYLGNVLALEFLDHVILVNFDTFSARTVGAQLI
jgi:hypothetical protein